MKVSRRAFLKVIGRAAIAGALSGFTFLEEENTAVKEKGYYVAEQPDDMGVYWSYYYSGSGSDIELMGYDKTKGAVPSGVVTLPGELDGFTVTEINAHAFYVNYEWYTENDPDRDLSACDFSKVTELTIPASIRSVGQDAFNACVNSGYGSYRVETSLKKVAFLGRISLGRCAFSDCEKLEEIVGGEYISCIPTMMERTCFNNTGLKRINVTSGMMTERNFQFCEKLEYACVEDSVTEISTGLFKGCASMKEVYIPSSVTTIGENAFNFTSKVKAKKRMVYYGGTQEEWNTMMANLPAGNDFLKSSKVTYEATGEKVGG